MNCLGVITSRIGVISVSDDHLNDRTSAFKNCLFGGSLPSILPSLSSWQSSAHYYGCSVPSTPEGHVLLGSFVPSVYNSDPLRGSDPLRPLRGSDPLRGGDKHCWAHGKIMVGSIFLRSIPGDKAGCYEIMGGESDFNSG